jgi:hypothetical protein
MTDLIDFQISLKNFVLDEISQMIILEMISNREILFSTTFASSKFDHIATLSISKVIDQIEIAIHKISQKIQINSKAFQHFSIDSISDVQIRFESMIRQARFDSFNRFNSKRRIKAKSSADFVTINTRSRTRKQTYATTLIIVNQLSFYFAHFRLNCSVRTLFLSFSNCIKMIYRRNLVIEDKCWIIAFLKNFNRLQSRKWSNWKNATSFHWSKNAWIRLESYSSECSNINLIRTNILKNSKHDCASEMTCKWFIKTFTQSH